jgi:hypothetical protein
MKTKFIYYDKETGRIKEILGSRKRGRAPYIETDFENVRGLITGEMGMNQWVIAYNTVAKKHVLMEKDNVIKFREIPKTPMKIPYKKNAISDLTLVYYSDNVLEVSLDVSRIAPLYQTNFKDEVRFERGTEIRIIAREKDSGNLLKEFVIEAEDLLDSVQIFFELFDHIYPDNVEFFTYKMFGSYSWSKGTIKLISPMKDRIKFHIHKADSKLRSKDFTYHLIMTPTEKGLKIINNIESLKLIRFYDDIEFYLVDKHDPNILYEKFSLNEDELQESVIMLDLKTDAKDKSILYNHKYISVLKE